MSEADLASALPILSLVLLGALTPERMQPRISGGQARVPALSLGQGHIE